MRSFAAMLVAAALLAGAVGPASAYTTYTCLGDKLKWNGNTARLRPSATSFPAGSAYTAALDEAISTWNNNPSNFYFTTSYNEPSVGMGNGESEVWFSNDASILSGAPAITYTWWNCYWLFGNHVNYTEADVIFDVNVAWSPSNTKGQLWPYGGRARPFQTTAMHELGHALGLGHENRTYNIMGEDWTHIHANGGTTKAYPGEDASHGAVFLYGLWSASPQDVGVVHWRYVGASGEYSTHARTRLFNTSGAELSRFMDAGEPRYWVRPGDTIRLELTYENNGATTQYPTVEFYLSTNDYISRSDTYLSNTTMTLVRSTVLTTTHTLTLPSWLVPGTNYHVGALIDPTSLIGESNESNNATYIGVRAY